ncbi:hypothetical protein CesoFtcFv8_000599 [Champsocephalus esox]|uniref:Uncharacterized protein n=1 Tax=Champsocephalus esox TaxID=159716 RepID=A0AAN8HGZ0_9TELE|nr:hypothetical protein CesoFtcFv8_000599 [Champsocephalus esox]
MGRLSIGQAEEKRETHSSVHMGSVRSTELPTRAVQTRRVPPAVKVTGMQLLTLTRRAGPQPPSERGERDIDVKARRGPANRRSNYGSSVAASHGCNLCPGAENHKSPRRQRQQMEIKSQAGRLTTRFISLQVSFCFTAWNANLESN